MDYERLIERTRVLVVDRPGTVVVAFLVLTAVFATGLGATSTETGTSQFTQGSPAQEAFEEVDRRFGRPFEPGEGSTQLIYSAQNVLAKEALLRMLRVQDRIADRPGLRVSTTSSAARIVAQRLDPEARTLDAQIRAVEAASESEIDAAVRTAARGSGFRSLLSRDFNRESASASATIAVVSHRIPGGLAASAGTSGGSPLTPIQREVSRIVATADADMRVFGTGVLSDEFSSVIFDSLIIVVPAAALLILVFLVYAYRDPFDLLLGVVSLVMAVVWTFGSMGLLGIPFTQMLIAVPPLLLAVGIDFGIHIVNRYREERIQDVDPRASMTVAAEQLIVAFFIVTGTTVIGFGANLTSSLGPIRDFGLVAAMGIVFTFAIFGIFLPAAKLLVDSWRERRGLPRFGQRPIGDEGSLIGRSLSVGTRAARVAPRAFLVGVILLSVAAGAYGTGIDTSFNNEDFLPPEDVSPWLKDLPEPFRPSEYTVTETLNFLEDTFASAQSDTVTVFVSGPLRSDHALESIHRAGRDPPDAFVSEDRQAEATSIISVIDDLAARDPEFRRLVERNDRNDNGVPDENLGRIYGYLLDSPVRDRALTYITEDYRYAQVVYSVESEASSGAIRADARQLADRYRFRAIATGQTIVFQGVADVIFTSAVRSLTTALALTAVFLVIIYRLLFGQGSLGLVNVVPIVLTVALLVGTMRLLGVPFNALTATVLAIAIGLGVDYSAHIVHRFTDEYATDNDINRAIDATVRGTGGALTGSMLTTTAGIGVLTIAITPILGQFGIVTALSIFYSYLTAVMVTPSVLVVWESIVTRRDALSDRLTAVRPGLAFDTHE